jgi:hypothetical protein
VDVAGAVNYVAVGDSPRRSERHEAPLDDPIAFGLALGDEATVDGLVEDLTHRDWAELLDYLDEGCVEGLDLG